MPPARLAQYRRAGVVYGVANTFAERTVSDQFSVSTRYWQVRNDGSVQCDVCPRHCHLHEGQRGLCFVRACENGEVIMTSYGRSTGFCVDPIEKKPLNHFPGFTGTVFWHRRLQSCLQVLPELGYQQIA